MIDGFYVKIDDFSKLSDLTKLEILLIKELTEFLETEGDFKDCILLNTAIRKKIIEDLDIKQASFNNSLSSLCKKNFIYRLDTNLYKLNSEVLKY